ncbi:MAG: HAD family phosphatase [Candidatus Latescibacterota bacterium]|nr:HAD family phosphatase [Candidatus Latescibacterota bacterium]
MSHGLNNIQAVIFDMDGTLIDSEIVSGRAVLTVLTRLGLDTAGLDLVRFHGTTWQQIELQLKQTYPQLAEVDLKRQIADEFLILFESEPPAFLPGARLAVLAAAERFPGRVAICTGSDAEAVENLLQREDLRAAIATYVSAEMYSPSKPDPSCYLLTSERLGVDPKNILVFEDSRPGMMAAHAAGMQLIAITAGDGSRREWARELARPGIDDYTNLPPKFFAEL